MPRFTVTYSTPLHLTVTVEAEDEDRADELASECAIEYLGTVVGNYRDVSAYATLDGVGADEVKEG